MHCRHIGVVALALCASNAVWAQISIHLPNGAATTEGSTNNTYPWGRNSGGIRFQQVYDSADFTAQGVTQPILISRARWRANGSTTSWSGTVYSNVEVSCSTSAVDFLSVSTTWANNRGPDFTQVHLGQVAFLPGTGNGTLVPGPTVVDLTFNAPFLYDPSSGNDFLIEVTYQTNSWSGGSTTACDNFTGAATLGSRVYNTDPNAPTGAGTTLNYAQVMQIDYVPASGLYSSFTATPTSGPTPLNVSFTDRTYTSDPAGVQTWAWDLNGDSIVDSNAPNPSFTYSVCGPYDVTLTTTDTQHPASTRTVLDFILADPQLLVQPSFTWAPGALPNSIQFTDTSTGSPSSWAWDLNGDNITDSVQQHPLWAYPTGGSYNVTLTAGNACGSATARSTVYVIANDDCTGAIPLVLGLNPAASNQNATTSQAWPCATGGRDVWYSYRSTCSGTLEINTCTGTNYDSSLEAFSGSCGALTSIVCNDDSCGLQSRISFGVQPATTYYLRVGGFNSAQGTFQLNLILTASGGGVFANVFPACGGSNLATTGAPNLGAAIGFTLTPATGLPFIMIGSIPLGVPICPAGCLIGHNMDVVLPGASFQTTVPCWPFLVGGQVYFQGIELGTTGGCSTGNPVQLVSSNTVRATIG